MKECEEYLETKARLIESVIEAEMRAAQRRAGGDNGLESIRGDRQGIEGEKAGVGAATRPRLEISRRGPPLHLISAGNSSTLVISHER